MPVARTHAPAPKTGHTIECGAQCSGGNGLVEWQRIPDLANVGYPIVAAHPDGTFEIPKHAGTGGRITVAGVTEQLVYEMGNPAEYITPDCVADFTTIRLAQAGKDRVRVSGVRGRPATDKLKVSIAYSYGRSEEHTSELQSLRHLVCRLLLEKKNKKNKH